MLCIVRVFNTIAWTLKRKWFKDNTVFLIGFPHLQICDMRCHIVELSINLEFMDYSVAIKQLFLRLEVFASNRMTFKQNVQLHINIKLMLINKILSLQSGSNQNFFHCFHFFLFQGVWTLQDCSYRGKSIKLICDSLELSHMLYFCFRVWHNVDSNFGNDRFHIKSNQSGNLKGQHFID